MRSNAQRWSRAVRPRRAGFAFLAVWGGALALASVASAGQIVWSTGDGIWAMNDDGTHARELVSTAAPSLVKALTSGTLASPDVFQNGGTSVLFLGRTAAFAPSNLPAACGADCSGTFELSNGLLTALGPAAGPATGAAYWETQPRVTADGQELFGSQLTTGIASDSAGTSADALVERQIAASAQVTQWADTGAATEPVAGFDGAPNPKDPTQAAWVQAQGCNHTVPDTTVPSCQYAVEVGGQASSVVSQYDNEAVSANGTGPSSLSWSADGTQLLLVDPFAPPAGIYSFPAVGKPGTGVTEVLTQPPGWMFGQARFAGSKIVFDAHQLVGGHATGDIYTIPASCTSASCTFPSSATNLTNDPSADSSAPAWTSATAPLAPLAVPGGPVVTRLALPQTTIRAGHRFTLTVTISAPGTIIVKFARRSGRKARTLGSLSFAGRTGPNRLAIELVGGRSFKAGSYIATAWVRASHARTRAVTFTVAK